MKRFLISCMMSALLWSCGPDLSKYKKCGLGIRLEDTSATCDYAERDLRDVRAYLGTVGLDTDPPGTVLFHATKNFKDSDGREVSGNSSLGLIETDVDASSLAHEMLHQREGSMLIIGTSSHEGWSSKGFYGLDMFWSWIVTMKVIRLIGSDFCVSYEDLRPDHAVLLREAGYPVDQWRLLRTRTRASEHCPP